MGLGFIYFVKFLFVIKEGIIGTVGEYLNNGININFPVLKNILYTLNELGIKIYSVCNLTLKGFRKVIFVCTSKRG